MGVSPDMTTVFHVWLYDRFIEIQSKLRRKKLHRMNQGSNFREGTFSNRDNVRAPTYFGRESQPQYLKRWYFSSRTNPSIFTSIAPVILDQPNESSWDFPVLKSTSHWLPQSTVSCRSGSKSEAISSCCHRSDTWSHLEKRVASSA